MKHSGAVLNDSSVLRLIQIALAEDIGVGDVTSDSLVAEHSLSHANVLVKEQGVVAGTKIAELTFREVNPDIDVEWSASDGDYVEKGTIIGHIQGPSASILTGERTALNFMQRMSGVASLTRRYVKEIEGTAATVLDTRKTIPAWRILDKYSVVAGGGKNHRMGLYDMVMIKDNHIAAHGSITRAVDAVLDHFRNNNITGVGVEVETTNLQEVEEALGCDGVTRIMLDNFPVHLLDKAVEMIDRRVETEASGGITLETIRVVAETGVQFISVGALTHSATALDISLDFVTK